MATTTNRPTTAANAAAIEELQKQLAVMKKALEAKQKTGTIEPSELGSVKADVEIIENKIETITRLVTLLGESEEAASAKVAEKFSALTDEIAAQQQRIVGLATAVDTQRIDVAVAQSTAEGAQALAATANRNAHQARELGEETRTRLEGTTAVSNGTTREEINWVLAIVLGLAFGLAAALTLPLWEHGWEGPIQVIWVVIFAVFGFLLGSSINKEVIEITTDVVVPGRAQAQPEADEPADEAPANQPEPPADPPTQVMPATVVVDEETPNA